MQLIVAPGLIVLPRQFVVYCTRTEVGSMSLGERIKALRRRAGLSQEQVAEQVGVSRQAVAKWEAGQSAPSTEI